MRWFLLVLKEFALGNKVILFQERWKMKQNTKKQGVSLEGCLTKNRERGGSRNIERRNVGNRKDTGDNDGVAWGWLLRAKGVEEAI